MLQETNTMNADETPAGSGTPLRRRSLLALGGACSLAGLAGLGALALPGCQSQQVPGALSGPAPPPASSEALLDDLEKRCFLYFWEQSNPVNGLVPDRWPTPSFASVAAVGFALSAYPVAVARGWVTREQARARTLVTLRFFRDAPQGGDVNGMTGHQGFFYHFLDMQTGARFGRVELSTVDTALFLAGALHCQVFFDGNDVDEATIRRLADEIYLRVNWPWAQVRPPSIGHGWHPEGGHIPNDWKGYNEAMLVYLLALGSPSHPVAPAAWEAWTSTYDRDSWGREYGQSHLRFAPLFGHQFTHCWVDFRGLQDDTMRRRGLDYFENSRRATYAQQAYAIANPEGWAGYSRDIWGITACDGPADIERSFGGRKRRFISYAGRGMGGVQTYDDGTIAPYGAGSSAPFAPEIVLPALAAMHQRHGQHIYGRYGYLAFNQSFTYTDVRLTHGRVVPGFGWVDSDWLGIEVGPLLAMLANHRGELVWKAMRSQEHLVRGLKRAGFRGGWLG